MEIVGGPSRAGVRLDSSVRDEANWLSTPSMSEWIYKRRRFGCVRMVFSRCVYSQRQVGALPEMVERGCGEGNIVAECLRHRASVLLHALSDELAPDSASVEGRSIGDDPGEC